MTQSPQHTDKEQQAKQLWQVYHSYTPDYFWARYEALLASAKSSTPKVAPVAILPKPAPVQKPAKSVASSRPALPPANELKQAVFRPSKWTYVNRWSTLIAIFLSVGFVVFYMFFGGTEYLKDKEGMFVVVLLLILMWGLYFLIWGFKKAHKFSVAQSGVYIEPVFPFFTKSQVYVAWADIKDMDITEVIPTTENDQIKHMLTIVPKKGATQSFIYHLSDNDHRDFVRAVKRRIRYFKCTSSKYYPV